MSCCKRLDRLLLPTVPEDPGAPGAFPSDFQGSLLPSTEQATNDDLQQGSLKEPEHKDGDRGVHEDGPLAGRDRDMATRTRTERATRAKRWERDESGQRRGRRTKRRETNVREGGRHVLTGLQRTSARHGHTGGQGRGTERRGSQRGLRREKTS